MKEPFRIDDSRMPVVLGSALKVPSYAYPDWGIPGGRYRDRSDALYQNEWRGGSPRQMQYVIDAITRTGLGNYSGMLRAAAAETVRRIMERKKGRINILEPGAGVSTEVIYRKLYDEGEDLDRLTFTMIEPAQSRVEASADKILSEYGLKRGKHLHVYVGRDTDAARFAEPASQDIVVCVAQIHHHAYLDTPMRALFHVTAPGGYIATYDWHNSMWEHPARVFSFLQEIEWETKGGDLEAFAETFPKAKGNSPETSSTLREANEHIRHFWRDGWAVVRSEAIERGQFDPADDILMLEGHRPVDRYVQEMEAAGYDLHDDGVTELSPDNPRLLIPENEILAEIIARKPVE